MAENIKVKTVIHTLDGHQLFVAGKSKRLNLLGGGQDAGESDYETLLRESQEEAGVTVDMITTPSWLGVVQGPVTSGEGIASNATWHVYEAGLLIDPHYLTPSSEIEQIVTLKRQAAFSDARVSDLAKMALRLK